MTCEASRELMQLWFDEELDGERRPEIEAHMASCADCAAARDGLVELRRQIRGEAVRFQAPSRLTPRIRSALRHQRRPNVPWPAMAATFAAAAVLVWGIVMWHWQSDAAGQLPRELVDSHVRALMPGHLVDVPSSDQHTVKPWFAGKIDFSPRVKDLAGDGFPLEGGRLDYVDRRTVAVMVFRRRQHVIDVFVWPAADQDMLKSPLSLNGFNVVHWMDAGLAYWAVSDVAPDELREFAMLYRRLDVPK